ncbi:MAG: sensor histidine kinase [Roseburia inulinivorans]
MEQELEYIKNYMALINLRFDYEIYLSLNLPELVLKQEIPKMSLRPIVENAIYHGIEQMAEDTNIYIKGILDGDDCVIEITDAGKGMSEEEVEKLRLKIAGKIDSNGGSGNGIGLKNVQDRIHIAFWRSVWNRDRIQIGVLYKNYGPDSNHA